jgi:transcription initiation factor TFIID subunit 1
MQLIFFITSYVTYLLFSGHKYHNRKEFLADINLIFENSVAYNGEDSEFTQQAKKLISVATESLEEVKN